MTLLPCLLAEGTSSGDLYLTSLELGNEVMTGSGRTEMRGCKVTIR